MVGVCATAAILNVKGVMVVYAGVLVVGLVLAWGGHALVLGVCMLILMLAVGACPMRMPRHCHRGSYLSLHSTAWCLRFSSYWCWCWSCQCPWSCIYLARVSTIMGLAVALVAIICIIVVAAFAVSVLATVLVVLVPTTMPITVILTSVALASGGLLHATILVLPTKIPTGVRAKVGGVLATVAVAITMLVHSVLLLLSCRRQGICCYGLCHGHSLLLVSLWQGYASLLPSST